MQICNQVMIKVEINKYTKEQLILEGYYGNSSNFQIHRVLMHKIFPNIAWSILNSDNKTSPYFSDFFIFSYWIAHYFPFFFPNLLSFQYFIRCFELLMKFNEYQSIFLGSIVPKVDSSFYMIRNLRKKMPDPLVICHFTV